MINTNYCNYYTLPKRQDILLIAILFLLQPWLIFNQVNLIIDTSFVVPNFKVNEFLG